MTDFTRAEVADLLAIQRAYSGMFLSDAVSHIMSITKPMPLVEREQFRLFALFSIYKYQVNSGRVRSGDRVPPEIFNFHQRLLHDVASLSHREVEARCEKFASGAFLCGLEMVARGCPELERALELVKCKPTGRDFLELLEGSKGATINVAPEFLAFLPKVGVEGGLITDEEYEQVRLY